jgi:hypothetical protein
MEQKLDILKIWPPDFAQKTIYRILNLSKTTCELISQKKIHEQFLTQNMFFLKNTYFDKNKFIWHFYVLGGA